MWVLMNLRSECKEESQYAYEILRYTQDDNFVDASNNSYSRPI
jgi:hypothetical protein